MYEHFCWLPYIIRHDFWWNPEGVVVSPFPVYGTWRLGSQKVRVFVRLSFRDRRQRMTSYREGSFSLMRLLTPSPVLNLLIVVGIYQGNEWILLSTVVGTERPRISGRERYRRNDLRYRCDWPWRQWSRVFLSPVVRRGWVEGRRRRWPWGPGVVVRGASTPDPTSSVSVRCPLPTKGRRRPLGSVSG